MNSHTIIDAMEWIDDDMIHEVETLRTKNRNPTWVKWVTAAACFVVMAISWFSVTLFYDRVPTDPNPSTPAAIQSDATKLIYVNGQLYIMEPYLSQTAAHDNVGSFIGFISLDNERITDIRAYNYHSYEEIPNRIIFIYNDTYYVFSLLTQG